MAVFPENRHPTHEFVTSHDSKVAEKQEIIVFEGSLPTSEKNTPPQISPQLQALHQLAERLGRPVPPTDTTPTTSLLSQRLSRRAMLRVTAVAGATAAVASVPVISTVMDLVGYGADAERRKALEHPNAKYFPIVKQSLTDAFGEKFGPVMPATPTELGYPPLPDFVNNTKITKHKPPEYSWSMRFNLIGPHIYTQPTPMEVILDFDDIEPKSHTLQTLKNVRVRGSVQSLFPSLSTFDERSDALATLLNNHGMYTVTDISRKAEPVPKFGITDRGSSTQSITEAVYMKNEKTVAVSRLDESGNFSYNRFYNIN